MPNWKKIITSGSSASLANIFVDNAVTASYFKGDGSALTNVTTEIAETATVSDTFTSVTEKVVTHSFNTKNVIVTVYNDSDEQIIPSTVVTTDVNTVTVTFDTATSGRIVVAKGGHLVQGIGTASDSNTLNGQSGSYYLDLNNHSGALTASAVSTSYIDLDILADGATPVYKEGRIYYNSEDGALTVYNDEANISLQVGQENYVRGYNLSGQVILNGTPVRISGSQGDRVGIVPAIAEDHSTGVFEGSHILGVATHTIGVDEEGYVTTQGIVRGVTTEGFTDGDILYLQTGSAGFVNTPPPFPYDIVQVGYVTKVANPNGFITIDAKEPVHFSNISGLSGSATSAGDLWLYKSNNAWSPGKGLEGDYTLTSGSFLTTGSKIEFLSYPWPAVNEETHFLKTQPFSLAFNNESRSYDYAGIALEHIDDSTNFYHNSITMYTFNNHDNPDYGGELSMGPIRTEMRQLVSGSNSTATVAVQELTDGRAFTNIYGNLIHLGVYLGEEIRLGHTGSDISISASHLEIHSDITASGHIVPKLHETYDLGSPNLRWRDIYLSGSTIDLGGTKITRDLDGNISLSDGSNNLKKLKVDEIVVGGGAKKVVLKVDDNNKLKFEDATSGVTESPTFFKTSISGQATYNITHSLAEDYPIVQVYDTNKNQVLPGTITSSNENVVQIVFDSNFNGTVVVKK